MGEHAAADPVARLENYKLNILFMQIISGRKAGKACPDKMTFGFFPIKNFPQEEEATNIPAVARELSFRNCLRELIRSTLV